MVDSIIEDFLNVKAEQYEQPDFVKDDPINIPRRFSIKQDIEISGFLTATIAWGQRKSIINNANRIMKIMDESPHDFIVNHEESDLKRCKGFVHRTFNEVDLKYFFTALQRIYLHHGGLEETFRILPEEDTTKESISRMRSIFFGDDIKNRSQKHISNICGGW